MIGFVCYKLKSSSTQPNITPSTNDQTNFDTVKALELTNTTNSNNGISKKTTTNGNQLMDENIIGFNYGGGGRVGNHNLEVRA